MNSRCSADTSRLHESGEIQGCGQLFVVEEVEVASTFPSGIRVVGASANVVTASWTLVTSTADLLGKDLGCLRHGECVNTVRSLLARHKEKWKSPSADDLKAKIQRNLETNRPLIPRIQAELALLRQPRQSENKGDSEDDLEILTCTLAGSNPGLYLMEVEKKHGPQSASTEPKPGLLQVADVLGRVSVESDPQVMTGELCDALMEKFPAYDRVMVYRFAADDSGKVIHETIRPGSGVPSSYLGLHFPALNIPATTRNMLKLNGTRFTADTSNPGVPIELLEKQGTTLDLSMSTLRATSKYHLAYLRNMGVKSSLVVAIVVDGELWGLYSFHSYARVVAPSCEERILAETAAAFTSSLISFYQRKEIAKNNLAVSRTLATFSNFVRVDDFLSAKHKALLDTLAVDSIVLCQESRPVIVYGNKEISLTPEECKNLLHEFGSDHTVLFKSLEARGIAFFSVRSSLVAFLRGSIARHVKWAGKADLPLLDQDVDHPRASFELYMKTATAKFEAWSPATVDLLQKVRHGISSHLYDEALPADLQAVFAHMFHELRTPFHAVMASLDLLQAGHASMDDEERRDIIGSAVLCGTSMMSTLNDMVEITRDRSNVEVASERFFASKPVNAVIAAMKQYAAEKAVELTIVISVGSVQSSTSTINSITNDADGGNARPYEVIGDEPRVQKIVECLVSNAINYTPDGGKVQVSLFMFASRQDARDWWAKETARFDENIWVGSSPTADGADDVVKEASRSESDTSFPRAIQGWYMYCVEDTGVGIRKGGLRHLLKAYRQVSHGPSKSHQGTGLGLHVCKLHVDIMCGNLGIASTFSGDRNEQGGGTLFAVALPLTYLAAGVENAEPNVLHAKCQVGKMNADAIVGATEAVAAITGAAFASGGGEGDGANKSDRPAVCNRKVAFLVVDDQKINVKLMEKKIAMVFQHSHTGVQVLLATDGMTALEVLSAARKDEAKHGNDCEESVILAGVFMDFHMPNMDGIECTRRVRQLEAEKGWSSISICGFTADPTEGTRERFQDAGGGDIIYKPWGPGQVEDVCNAMLIKVLEVDNKKEGSEGAVERGARREKRS